MIVIIGNVVIVNSPLTKQMKRLLIGNFYKCDMNFLVRFLCWFFTCGTKFNHWRPEGDSLIQLIVIQTVKIE